MSESEVCPGRGDWSVGLFPMIDFLRTRNIAGRFLSHTWHGFIVPCHRSQRTKEEIGGTEGSMSNECFEIMELKSTQKIRSRASTFRTGAWLCILGFCLIASSSQAANVTLGWDPSVDPDVVG